MRASVSLKKQSSFFRRCDSMTTSLQLYWMGPYTVYVPCGVAWIPADDGVNASRRDGGQTKVAEVEVNEDGTESGATNKSMNASTYRKKFAKRRQRHWFYDTSKHSEDDQLCQFDVPDDPDLQLYRLVGRKMRKYTAVKKIVEPEEKDESVHNEETQCV
jgi:hypothetical protein